MEKMTKKRLKELRRIQAEVELLQERKAELRAVAEGTTGSMSGMPRGTDISDRCGKYAVLLADIELEIDELIAKCLEEIKAVFEYIGTVPNSAARQLLQLRFVDGLTSADAAATIGVSERMAVLIMERLGLDGE